MNELSLFSGAGGGLLATKYLLGWTTIGYVEIEEYCQKLLRQRIKDGYLDNAPIFGDIRAFIDQGCAGFYRGITDVITAGPPCQRFSCAGNKTGENLWPPTLETIRLVGPKHLLLENVPNLLNDPYVYEIFGTLASLGYCIPWDCISAALCGANHKRSRLWISTANTESSGREGVLRGFPQTGQTSYWPKGPLDSPRDTLYQLEQRLGEPSIFGTNDGVAHRVDRLKAVGEGQVPIVVKTAWEALNQY